jgi:hypothetical protein
VDWPSTGAAGSIGGNSGTGGASSSPAVTVSHGKVNGGVVARQMIVPWYVASVKQEQNSTTTRSNSVRKGRSEFIERDFYGGKSCRCLHRRTV